MGFLSCGSALGVAADSSWGPVPNEDIVLSLRAAAQRCAWQGCTDSRLWLQSHCILHQG